MFNFLSSAHAEDVNLSTYYPSPYGSYQELRVEEASGNLGTFTGGVAQAGLRIISDYTAGNFTPGIFWTTSNNNPNLPKAGIWLETNNNASIMRFGTSNNYATGINGVDAMALDENGNLGIGNQDPQTRLHATTNNASTDTVTDVLTLSHSSTGAPTTSFGTGLLFAGESTSIAGRPMARLQSTWTTATDASRASNFQIQTLGPVGGVPTMNTVMSIDGGGSMDMPVDSATIRIPRKATTGDPAGGQEGMIYYNDADNKFRIFQGSGWTDMVAAGGGGATTIKFKTSDQSTNSTTFQNDNTLFFAVGANEAWEFEFLINSTISGSAPPKFKLSGPSLTGGRLSALMFGHTYEEPFDAHGHLMFLPYQIDSFSDNYTFAHTGITTINGVIQTGAASGNVTLQFAKAYGSGSVSIFSNSYVKARRIS